MDDARFSQLSDRSGRSQGDETGSEEGGETRAQGQRILDLARGNPGPLAGATLPAPPRPSALRAVDAPDPARSDPAPPDLRPFADQLMAIARQLRDGEFSAAHLPVDQGGGAMLPGGATPVPHSLDPAQQRRRYSALARKAYAARRRRGPIFGNPDLFGEPAWDILLDLYIAHAEAKDVSVSSACIGSAAPPTTGLRWLGVLAEAGLIKRKHDPADQRRVLVHLSERGLEAMDRYFATISGQP